MISSLRDIKISKRIPASIAIFILLPFVVALIALNSTSDINDGGKEIYDNYFVSIVNLTDARKNTYEEYVWLKSHIISPDDKSMREAERRIDEASRKVYESMGKFEKTLDPGEETELFHAFQVEIEELYSLRDEIIKLSQANIDDKADELTNTLYRTKFLEIQQQFQDMFQTNVVGAELFYQKNQEAFDNTKSTILLASLVVIGIGILIGFVMISTILNPLMRMKEDIDTISRTGDMSHKLHLQGKDEIYELSKAFNAMIESLNNIQGKLIQNEKMASLGSLVAGVSHEINTPIGIAVTMGSTFENDLKEFVEVLKSGKIRRGYVESFEQDALKGLNILLPALDRAATLIHSFKQVAIDQTSEERRTFNLAEVVDEVVNTLSHQIKRTEIRYEQDIPRHIKANSYPGPLGQVITNLFNNALIHGFEDKKEGVIRISARADNDQIVLKVEDDGKGIPEELIGRVFDPFFTTRMGQGGSGLGLNIAYNAVEGLMGGEITVESQVNDGTCFTITIPTNPAMDVFHEPRLYSNAG